MEGFQGKPGKAASGRRPRHRLVALAVALGLGAQGAHGENIDTVAPWDHESGITYWDTGAPTYGQILTPGPGQHRLEAFEFQLRPQDATAIEFQAFVYRWDAVNARIAGDPLFASPVLGAPVAAGATSGFSPVRIDTGGVELAEGERYALFFSRAAVPGQSGGSHAFGYLINAYPGGNWIFSRATNLVDLGATAWTQSVAVDLAFLALFEPPVPLPPAMILPSVSDAVAGTGNPLAAPAAAVIDATPELLDAFAGMPDDPAVAAAAVDTLPILNSASTLVASQALADVGRVVQARLRAGASSGDGGVSDRRLWLKPFASRTDQDARSGAAGYAADSAGFVVGADAALPDRWRAGVAFAYARASVDGDTGIPSHALEVRVHQLIGYTSLGLDEHSDASFQFDCGRNRNAGRRGVLGAVASSTFDSHTVHAGASLARRFAFGENSFLVPSVRADYSRIRDEAYLETGAGLFNLAVEGQNIEEFIVGADARLAHDYGNAIRVDAALGAGYDVINERASVIATFAGAPGAAFATRGIAPSPWLGRAGLGLSYTLANGAEIHARYDAEFRQDFLTQTASLKARWLF